MNRFVARLVCALGLLAALAAQAQSLINVDFGGSTVSARSGPAAAGLGTNDVWNAYSHYVPRFAPGMAPVSNGRLDALRFADGSVSHVALTVTNAPGVWGNASGDAMFDSFIFAPNGSNLVVTVTGLDAGRYHFLLYGHADADVSPEQNSVFTLRTGGAQPVVSGPLTSAGATGWKAGQPWQEGRQYVVFRDVTVTADEAVVIEAAPGSGGVAVLGGLQVLARGTAPPRLVSTGTPPALAAVTNLLFREIRYEGVLGANDARFKVVVEAESRSTNELSAVLFEGDLALLAPKLPAGWRVVNAGRQFVLTAGAPGSHRLEFEVAAKVTRAEPWNQIAFTGPPAAIAGVTASGSADTEIQLTSGTVLEDGPANQASVRGVLGADQRLALRWQGRAAEVARDALVAVDTRVTARVTPSVIRFTTTLRYDVLQGRVAQLKLVLPADHALTRLSGDAVRDWQVTPGDGQQLLTVEFLRPIESASTLTLLTEQPVTGLPATAMLGLPQPLGVQRETGSFSLAAEDVVARVGEAAGLRQVNAAAGELAAFRFNARPVSLRSALTRVEPVVDVAARVQAVLEESRLLVRHELALSVTRAGIYGLDLTLPAGLAVSEVTGEGVEDWKAAAGQLHVTFGQRVLGDRVLAVQLEQALTGTPPEIVLTPLRVTGATKETAFIGARAVAGLNLKTATLDGAREIPVAALAGHREEQLAYRADTGDWRLTLGAERLASRLAAEVFNLVTVGDGLVGGSATIRFAIVNQGVPSFRVRLPRHWRNIEFTGPNLRRTDHQDDVWTLSLQDKAWGAYTLVVTYDHAFDPKQATLDAAGAHPLDVEREDGTVAITAAPGLEVKPGPVTDPLRLIDATELAPTDRALITRPVLLAYRYDGTNFALALDVTRHEQVTVLDAVADRAQLTSVLTERGEMLTQAAFMVKNNERQYQRFQLPPGATLWGVAVNGDPVKADRDGDWVLVSLPRGENRDRTFAVDLTYEQPLGALGRLGGLLPRGLEFIAPKTDVPGTYAEWELYTPPSQRVAGFGGNMTVARGTTYGFRDGWDEFIRVYQGLWHDFGAGLIVTAVSTGFLGSLWVLGRKKGFRGLVQVLGVFAVLAVLAGMMLPALSKAKAKASRISSVNNLKNIGLAARIFATDHEGRMPVDFAAMMAELSTDKILVHPATGERYTWIGSGKSETDPDQILAYGPAVEGRREVLMSDGSVQQVTAGRFDEMIAKELSGQDATTNAYSMDATLARRYGLATGAARKIAGDKLAAAADAPAEPMPVPPVNPGAIAGQALNRGAAAPAAAPTVAGLRSLKIEVPKSGRAYQFTRVLNLSGEPPSIRVSVMSSKAFVLIRTLGQLVAFAAGLLLAWWQWRRAEPNPFRLALGLGLALVATANLFIAWRALHLVLIVTGPALLFLLLAWLVSRWLARRRPSAPKAPPAGPPAPPAPPVGPWLPVTPTGGAALVLLLFAIWSQSPLAAETVRGPNPVSIVSAAFTGNAHERVAQLDAVLEFDSAGTNQAVTLFGQEIAVQEFAATAGEVRLWRDGERVGVLLPAPGPATAKLRLLVKLGGDVGRRTLDFGLPPALGTRLTLTLDEPDAEVEFPGAIAFSRTTVGAQTKLEAVLGATGRLALAWTPRLKRATDSAATVFAQQASLVTFGNGVVATRSVLDFTTPQGELRAVRVSLPAGQRLLRVGGELVRGWDYADTNRGELVIRLLKSAANVRVEVETEAALEQLPASVAVAVPRPLDVKRATGFVAVRDGEELGLTVGRTSGLERVENAEFARAMGDDRLAVTSAWRFLERGFDLPVKAEVPAPKVEAVVRNHFTVGFEQVSVAARADYTISRAGVFTLRLALPAGARVEAVACAEMQAWSERTDGGAPELEVTLKQRTLGAVAVEMILSRSLTNLPPALDLAGVHPLGVDKLNGFVSVSAEPGVGVKLAALRGLTEIPATALPGGRSGNGLLAFKLLAAEPGPAATWALQLATETVESWVRAEVADFLTVGETLVSGRAVVRYDIQNAPVKEFRLRVPAAWRNVEITGAGVRRRDQTNGAAGTEWRVELQTKVRGDFRLTVHWEQPRTATDVLAAAGVEALGAERETGTVAFFTKGQLQLVPKVTGEELLRVDARELPALTTESGNGSPVLSYRYLRPGWKLALEVKRFRDAALLQALVEKAQLRTVVADDGQMMTQLELSVRNNGKQHLEITLPTGAEVWSAFVDGEPLRPARNGGRLLLPLETARGGDAAVSVELTYVDTGKFPRTGGKVELVSPRLDVPLKDAHWEVFLPPDYDYTGFAGTMDYERADLAPMAQDFTLASYRRQEQQQQQTLDSQAVDFLSSTRKEVAAGKYDNAGKLSQFRSRALRDDSAKRELQVLEETVAQGQGGSLLQAQRNYAANNSLQLGVQAPSSTVVNPDLYDAEVAAKQVVQLNRAQEVAVARVTPLRVNLPTRGIRHAFAQVLQTEVNKPLTVSFHAQNDRRTGWFKLALFWGGGFVVLWAVTFAVTLVRPARWE